MPRHSSSERPSGRSPGASAERRRGRPPTIDREAVLDTAICLLDAEGVAALTMRRLASKLGVSAMAPYRHFASKDELLMVLVDRLAARLVYPPRPPDPKGAILALWSTIYDSLAEHPWIPEVLARRRMMAPSVLDAVEEIHTALRDAGLSVEAAVRAVETVDRCLRQVVDAVPSSGGACIVTAADGNADHMLEPDGSPNTAHSLNPVPLIVTVPGLSLREGGVLADVAPTILEALGIEQPEAMTGRSPAGATGRLGRHADQRRRGDTQLVRRPGEGTGTQGEC